LRRESECQGDGELSVGHGEIFQGYLCAYGRENDHNQHVTLRGCQALVANLK
ncbi:unnamed protein product, partial [Ilex paraguariensis]